MAKSDSDNDTIVWAVVGGLFLLFAPSTEPVRLWAKGLVTPATVAQSSDTQAGNPRAASAKPALFRNLEVGEQKELFQGTVYFLHDQYADALPILGKFALLGDRGAQTAIGSMYYFGKGIPLDREEGIRWLSLAARQGGVTERQALAAAIQGTLEFESSVTRPEMAYGDSGQQPQPYAPAVTSRSNTGLGYGADIAGMNGTMPGIAPHRSVDGAYGAGSTGREFSTSHMGAPWGAGGSPVILNPAGPGTYSDGNGDVYAQAGPHGVVNTRTGEFSPTN